MGVELLTMPSTLDPELTGIEAHILGPRPSGWSGTWTYRLNVPAGPYYTGEEHGDQAILGHRFVGLRAPELYPLDEAVGGATASGWTVDTDAPEIGGAFVDGDEFYITATFDPGVFDAEAPLFGLNFGTVGWLPTMQVMLAVEHPEGGYWWPVDNDNDPIGFALEAAGGHVGEMPVGYGWAWGWSLHYTVIDPDDPTYGSMTETRPGSHTGTDIVSWTWDGTQLDPYDPDAGPYLELTMADSTLPSTVTENSTDPPWEHFGSGSFFQWWYRNHEMSSEVVWQLVADASGPEGHDHDTYPDTYPRVTWTLRVRGNYVPARATRGLTRGRKFGTGRGLRLAR